MSYVFDSLIVEYLWTWAGQSCSIRGETISEPGGSGSDAAYLFTCKQGSVSYIVADKWSLSRRLSVKTTQCL